MKKFLKPLSIALICALPLIYGKTFVPVFADSPIEIVQKDTRDK